MTQDPQAIATRLLQSRRGGAPVTAAECQVADAAAAYAVQDAVLAQLGPCSAWKVGAASPEAEPNCAPLPASGIHKSGVRLTGPEWKLRGIELEVAVRLGRDLGAADAADLQKVSAAIDAMLPAIEVVESRLADRKDGAPHLPLADLQSHGALVLGEPMPWRAPDLKQLATRVTFDGQVAADVVGGHALPSLLPLLFWLARHAEARGRPLRAGDVITTGSCTGIQFAAAGARIEGTVQGLGVVTLQF